MAKKKVFEIVVSKIFVGAILLGFIALWQVSFDLWLLDRNVFPSPKNVFSTLYHVFPILLPHMLKTFKEAIIGLLVSIVISFPVFLCMDKNFLVKKIMYPFLVITQSVPIIVFAPLFVLWFGFGDFSKIIVVTLICFFPITMSLQEGAETVEIDVINMMKCMGAKWWHIMIHVKLPATMSYFFSGLKIASSYSVMGAVIGEWLGGNLGLGVYMMRTKYAYALNEMFASIFLIVILSVVLFNVVSALQFLVLPWTRKELIENDA